MSILITFAFNLSYTVFLTTSLFTIFLSFLKLTGTIFHLPISILSIPDFNLAKFDFNATLHVSNHVSPFKSAFVE